MKCHCQSVCLFVLLLSVSHSLPAKLFGGPQQLSGVIEQDRGRQQQNNNQGNQGGVAPAQYEFAYDVKVPEEGNDYGHAERRNGDTTEGMYRVLLPDGRVQVVTYSVVGDSGFMATVTYE